MFWTLSTIAISKQLKKKHNVSEKSIFPSSCEGPLIEDNPKNWQEETHPVSEK
jgi:hypothetical protein